MDRRRFMQYGTGAFALAIGRESNAQSAASEAGPTIRIRLSSVFVEDQAAALTFYTEVLGFVKKNDIPLGAHRWLTVVSPREPEGTELLLEPNVNPAARTFQAAIFEQGIPATALQVDDIRQAFEGLRRRGVTFTVEPTASVGSTIATFDDTCGNLIQLYQLA